MLEQKFIILLAPSPPAAKKRITTRLIITTVYGIFMVTQNILGNNTLYNYLNESYIWLQVWHNLLMIY